MNEPDGGMPGSTLDVFLAEDGIQEEATEHALGLQKTQNGLSSRKEKQNLNNGTSMPVTLQKALVFHKSGFEYQSLLSSPTEAHYTTDMGALFAGDCLEILREIKDNTVDTVFADPPFNLNKNLIVQDMHPEPS